MIVPRFANLPTAAVRRLAALSAAIPPRVRVGLLVGGFLVLGAVHFLGLFAARIDLKSADLRETAGHAARFKNGFTKANRDFINRHGRILENGWARRSIPATSSKRVTEQGQGRFFVTDSGNLWFSSSDNAAITGENRTYHLEAPRKAPVWLIAAWALGLAVLAWRQPGIFPRWLLVATFLAVGLMAVFEQAWIYREANERFPTMDPDIWDYHCPALRFYDTGEINVHGNRSFLYPTVVGLLLRHGGPSFEYLTYQQQAISLFCGLFLAAGALIAVWRVFRFPFWVGCAVCLLCYALYAFSPAVIFYESALRPEIATICAFCILTFLAASCIVAKRSKKPAVFSVSLGFLVLCSVAIVFTRKSAGMVLFTPIILPLFLMNGLRAKVVAAALAGCAIAAVFLPLYAYQKQLQQRHDSEWSTKFFARYLMMWQADIIRPVLAEQAANEPGNAFLQHLHQAYEREFTREKIPGEFDLYYAKFGYKPEHIERNLRPYNGLISAEEKDRLYKQLFAEAVRKHPTRYARKIFGQLGWYYAFDGLPYPTGYALPEKRFAFTKISIETRAQVSAREILGNDAEMQRMEEARDLIHRLPPKPIVIFFKFAAKLFPVTLLLLPIAIGARIFAKNRENGVEFWDGLTLTAYASVVPFVVVFTFACLSSLSLDRFIAMLLPATLFAQICAICWIWRGFTIFSKINTSNNQRT